MVIMLSRDTALDSAYRFSADISSGQRTEVGLVNAFHNR